MVNILHITESFGGGVVSALNAYVENSSFASHYLIAIKRNADLTGEESFGLFDEVVFSNRGLSFLKTINNVYSDLNPDFVHVHSSFAGAIVRLFSQIPTRKIIYTPHAYSFLRESNSVLSRKIFYAAEKLLSLRTGKVGACSEEEGAIARSLNSKIQVQHIVNIAGKLPAPADVEPPFNDSKNLIICMIGRISAQKGFDFFVKVAEICPSANFLWIGGSDRMLPELPKNVHVTGWISRTDVLGYLKISSIYMHTAAWEGFPISVLEAAEFKKPILLRAIKPFSLEKLTVAKDIFEMKDMIVSFDSNSKHVAKNNQERIVENHSPERLEQALTKLYSLNNYG